jgi:hypothetical protein
MGPTRFQQVTYTVKIPGHADVDFKGERGQVLLYLALGIAAQQSFMRLMPIMVMEDGIPYRCVSVYVPPGKHVNPPIPLRPVDD